MWNDLVKECESCTKCDLHENRKQVVIERGNRNANIMFIGEGPGAVEDEQGIAFVGQSGKLLNLVLDGLGLSEDNYYLCNVIKCRPIGNATPLKYQALSCLTYLERQIELVKPEVIVLLGGIAHKYLMRSDLGITKVRGSWLTYKNINVMPTFHPAAILHDERKKVDMWKDIRNAIEKISIANI